MPCGGGVARFVRSNGKGIVARIHGDPHPRKTNEANARLIASAPELYEALKRLSFAAQITGGTAGRDDELVAAIDQAAATLAKARGDS